MDGMYLIRGGTHAGAEKVLSVWHTDKCRHYRLFKDEVSVWPHPSICSTPPFLVLNFTHGSGVVFDNVIIILLVI